MTRTSLSAAALSVVLLAGCGQTGPLYLPDAEIRTPIEIRGPAPPAPAVPAQAETPPTAPAKNQPDDPPPER
ncbi:MAG: hypothetical protein FJ191_09120 [Gammaproteobacteria bacterium]|nr:hypothetical protein [Gammaproteobacteria bacterium]